MSATRSDTDDTTDYDQASPRTVTGDAGTAEGGSLSASRLLRSVGRIVGLGSPQGVPSATNPSRHHTTLGTAPATAAEQTDPSGGVSVQTASVQVPPSADRDEQAEARHAVEYLARSVNDALAKHEVAEPSVNDAIFNMQPSDLSVAVSLLGDGAGDIFESNCEKYMQLFHLYDPAVIHARPTDHRAAHSDRSPTPYHSSNHPITGLTTGALPAGQPTPFLPASSPTDHGRGAVPPPAPYQTTPNPPTTYAHHSGPPAYDPSHPHPSQLPPMCLSEWLVSPARHPQVAHAAVCPPSCTPVLLNTLRV